ncbi:unnamed protein product [Owenia fusiformis]|uniref:Uncharacterized protein n=1 Tax=Owenia fusiformis TaxID=6347 RepID=A0A8J1T6G7_OWEFU|nr:unnamed protein product [Owenia fusiformis]
MSTNSDESLIHNLTDEYQNMTGKCHNVTGNYHNVTGKCHNVTGNYHNVTLSDQNWDDSSMERAISLLVITLIIILANTLTLIVAHKLVKQGQKFTNLFIFALAWTDLLVAVLVLPFSLAGHFGVFIDHHNIICKFSFLVTNTLTQMSVFLIVAMSVERYMAFVHPLVHKVKFTLTKARWTIVLIFATCFTGSILPVFGIGELDNHGYVCMIKWDSASLAGKIVMYVLAGAGIAMITLVWILNILVIYHLNIKQSIPLNKNSLSTRIKSGTESSPKLRVKKTLNFRILIGKCRGNAKMREKSRKNKSEIKFAQITIVLAFFFSLCWLPYCIRSIMVQSGYPKDKFIDFIVTRLAACNSMINPIIYGALKVGYRRGYLYLLRLAVHYVLCKQTERPNEESFLQSRTRGTYHKQCYSVSQTPKLLHSQGGSQQNGGSTSSNLDSIHTRHSATPHRNSPTVNRLIRIVAKTELNSNSQDSIDKLQEHCGISTTDEPKEDVSIL